MSKSRFGCQRKKYLNDIRLAYDEDQLAILLHHTAVFQDALQFHSHFLAPGGVWGMWGPRFKDLLPQ